MYMYVYTGHKVSRDSAVQNFCITYSPSNKGLLSFNVVKSSLDTKRFLFLAHLASQLRMKAHGIQRES